MTCKGEKMKITKKVINIANQIAKNAKRQRELNARLNGELIKMGVDLNDGRIVELIAYLEGDCSTQPLIDYLEYNL